MKELIAKVAVWLVILSLNLQNFLWASSAVEAPEVQLRVRIVPSRSSEFYLKVEDEAGSVDSPFRLDVRIDATKELLGSDAQIMDLNAPLESQCRWGFRSQTNEKGSRSLVAYIASETGEKDTLGFVIHSSPYFALTGKSPFVSLHLDMPESSLLLSDGGAEVIVGRLNARARRIQSKGKLVCAASTSLGSGFSRSLTLQSQKSMQFDKGSVLVAGAGAKFVADTIANEGFLGSCQKGLKLQARSVFSNDGGTVIVVAGDTHVASNEFTNKEGYIETGGATFLQAKLGNFDNSKGLIYVRNGHLTIDAFHNLRNYKGSIFVEPATRLALARPSHFTPMSQVFGKSVSLSFGVLENMLGQISELGLCQHEEKVETTVVPKFARPEFRGIANQGGSLSFEGILARIIGDVNNGQGLIYSKGKGKLNVFHYSDRSSSAGRTSRLISDGLLVCDAYDFDVTGVAKLAKSKLKLSRLALDMAGLLEAESMQVVDREDRGSPLSMRIEGSLRAQKLLLKKPLQILDHGKAVLGVVCAMHPEARLWQEGDGQVRIGTITTRLPNLRDLLPMSIEGLVRIRLADDEDAISIDKGIVSGRLMLTKEVDSEIDKPFTIEGHLAGRKGTIISVPQHVIVRGQEGLSSQLGEGGDTSIKAKGIEVQSDASIQGESVYLFPTMTPASFRPQSHLKAEQLFIAGAGLETEGLNLTLRRLEGEGGSYRFLNSHLTIKEGMRLSRYGDLLIDGRSAVDGGSEARLEGLMRDEGESRTSIYGKLAADDLTILGTVVEGLVQDIMTHGHGDHWYQTLSNQSMVEGRKQLQIICDRGYFEAALLRAGSLGLSITAHEALQLLASGLRSHHVSRSKRHTQVSDRLTHIRTRLESDGDVLIQVGRGAHLLDRGSVIQAKRDRHITAGEGATREHLPVTDTYNSMVTRHKKRGFLQSLWGGGSRVESIASSNNYLRPHETYACRDILDRGGNITYQGAILWADRRIMAAAESLSLLVGWEESVHASSRQSASLFKNSTTKTADYHNMPVPTRFHAPGGIVNEGICRLAIEQIVPAGGGVSFDASSHRLIQSLMKQIEASERSTLSVRDVAPVHHHEYYHHATLGALPQALVPFILGGIIPQFAFANLGGSFGGCIGTSVSAGLRAATIHVASQAILRQPVTPRGILSTVVPAGLNAGLLQHLHLDDASALSSGSLVPLADSFQHHLIRNAVTSPVDILSQTMIAGSRFEDALSSELRSGIADALGASSATYIGDLYAFGDIDLVTRYAAHGVNAVAQTAIRDGDLRGGVGAVAAAWTTELVGDALHDERASEPALWRRNLAIGLGTTVGSLLGADPMTAMGIATNATLNSFGQHDDDDDDSSVDEEAEDLTRARELMYHHYDVRDGETINPDILFLTALNHADEANPVARRWYAGVDVLLDAVETGVSWGGRAVQLGAYAHGCWTGARVGAALGSAIPAYGSALGAIAGCGTGLVGVYATEKAFEHSVAPVLASGVEYAAHGVGSAVGSAAYLATGDRLFSAEAERIGTRAVGSITGAYFVSRGARAFIHPNPLMERMTGESIVKIFDAAASDRARVGYSARLTARFESRPTVPWHKGIHERGMAYEDFVAQRFTARERLPQNFKTFDFHTRPAGVAISVKTLDTQTPSRLAKPERVYHSLKKSIDAVIDFERHDLSGKALAPEMISSRAIQVAVPNKTNSAQWTHIERAKDYARLNGIDLKIVTSR